MTEPGSLGSVAAGIYGIIVSASVMAASGGRDPIGKLAVTVLVTVLIYWLAERYAHWLAAHMGGRALTRRETMHVLAEGWPMVQASYTPLLVLLLTWLVGAEPRTAVLFALGYSILLLFVLGWLAAHRSGLTGMAKLGATAFAGTLGILIVILKLALH